MVLGVGGKNTLRPLDISTGTEYAFLSTYSWKKYLLQFSCFIKLIKLCLGLNLSVCNSNEVLHSSWSHILRGMLRSFHMKLQERGEAVPLENNQLSWGSRISVELIDFWLNPRGERKATWYIELRGAQTPKVWHPKHPPNEKIEKLTMEIATYLQQTGGSGGQELRPRAGPCAGTRPAQSKPSPETKKEQQN